MGSEMCIRDRSYITRVLSTMSRFGMRSLNRLYSHFFWFNLSAFRLASPPGGVRLPPEGEPCIIYTVLSVLLAVLRLLGALDIEARWLRARVVRATPATVQTATIMSSAACWQYRSAGSCSYDTTVQPKRKHTLGNNTPINAIDWRCITRYHAFTNKYILANIPLAKSSTL